MAAELVGTAFVAIRAITSGLGDDIKDGLNKGSADAKKDSEKSGRDIGDSMGEGVGGGLEDRLNVEIPGAINNASDSPESKRASEDSGKSMSRRMQEAFRNDGDNFTKNIGSTLSRSLKKIELPGGAFGFIALNALPLIGGIAQVAVALGAELVAMLGFIATAAAGAGVALAGVGGAILLSVIPAFLAFKAETPALEEFQDRLGGFKAAWMEVGEAAQEGLLPALGDSLDALKDLIPRYKLFGKEIGFTLGAIAKLSAEVLTSDKNLDAMGRVMASSVTVIGNFGRAIIAIFNFIPKLLDAAMPSAERFSDAIARMVEGWDRFITERSETGELTKTFDLWYDRLATIGSILGDFGVALWNVFTVGATASTPVFEGLAAAAQTFRDWTASMEGQNSLATFFDKAHDISSEVFRIIRDIWNLLVAPLVGGVGSSSDGIVGALETFRVDILPAIAELARIVAEGAAPVLGDLFDEISRFVQILADNPEVSGGVFILLGSSIGIFTVALGLLNDVLSTDVGIKLAEFLLPLLVIGKVAATVGILGPALNILSAAITGLGGALAVAVGYPSLGALLAAPFLALGAAIGVTGAVIIAIVAAIVGALALLYFHFQPFRDFVDNLVDALQDISLDDVLALPGQIMDAFQNIDWGALTETITGAIGDALGAAGGFLLDTFDTAVDAIPGLFRTAVNLVLDVMSTLPSRLGTIVATLFTTLTGWLSELAPKFAYYLGLATGTVLRWVLFELPMAILNAIPQVFDAILTALTSLFTGLIDFTMSQGPTILRTISDIFEALPGIVVSVLDGLLTVISTMFAAIPGLIVTALATLGQFLLGVLEGAWPGAEAAISGFIDRAIEFFTGLPGRITSALSSVASAIGDVFTGAVGFVGGAIEGLLVGAIAYFTGLPSRIVSGLTYLGSSIAGVFSDAWTWVETSIQGLFDNIADFFLDLPGIVIDAISGVASGLADALSGAFKTAWNSVINALPELNVGGWKVGTGPFSVTLPKINLDPSDFLKFAMGGIVDTPTFGLLGEAGREVVIPTTKPKRALELLQQSGLDQLITNNNTTTNNRASGPAVHIEHATFNDPVTVDILAAKLLSAIKRA